MNAVGTLRKALVLEDGRLVLPAQAAHDFMESMNESEEPREAAIELTALMAELMRQGEDTAPAVASLAVLSAGLIKALKGGA